MRKKLLTLIFFIYCTSVFSQSSESQIDNKSVPTFNGGDTKTSKERKLQDISIRTLKHIEQKTDSVFLRRLGLKENDSISFNLKFWVLADGTTPLDSVFIDTGVKSLDNYMKLMVNHLPKFIPANNSETGKNSNYEISMEAKFTVKEKKLKAIYNDLPEFRNFSPVLESCQNQKSDLSKRNCTNKVIHNHIFRELTEYFPRDFVQLRMLVQFTVDASGIVGDVKILRSDIASKEFHAKVIANFISLPRFAVNKNIDNHTKVMYILPMTIQMTGNNYNDEYQNENPNNWPHYTRARRGNF